MRICNILSNGRLSNKSNRVNYLRFKDYFYEKNRNKSKSALMKFLKKSLSNEQKLKKLKIFEIAMQSIKIPGSIFRQ